MTASLLRSRPMATKTVMVTKRATQPAPYYKARSATTTPISRECSNFPDLIARQHRKRPRVTFGSTVTVRKSTLSCSSYLGNPADSTWYTGADYTAFRLECAVTLKFIHRAFSRLQNGKLTKKQRLDPAKFTARGLEDVLTPVIKQRLHSQKLRHRRCVLTEHHIQRSHDTVDLNHLASVSEIMSSQSRRTALERGQSIDY